MSARRALALAVRNQLRLAAPEGLGFLAHECDVMFDGRPAPSCGKWFLAIHQGGRVNERETCLQDRHTLLATLTMRVDEPFDRIGSELVEKEYDGFDVRMDAIRALIVRQQWSIMAAANVLLGNSANDPFGRTSPVVNGFVEAIRPGEDGPAVAVNEDWFQAERRPKVNYHLPPFVGIKATLTLVGALRIQTLSDAGA